MDRRLEMTLRFAPGGRVSGTAFTQVGPQRLGGNLTGTWTGGNGSVVVIDVHETTGPRPARYVGTYDMGRWNGQVYLRSKEAGSWSATR